ncbi:MAG TPA: hypothetical protein VN885_00665 [Candidatus Acidoferrales bacterium]|nr:hypothetical protein [Candidatus Acidoferrales bacterium]
MFSHEITQEAMAMMMTDAKPQFVTVGRTLRVALLLPAAALIFLGSVFQLGMLGYGQLNPRDLWPAMLIVQSAWNLLVTHFNVPELATVFEFWPLLLVICGLGILLALMPSKRSAASRRDRERE